MFVVLLAELYVVDSDGTDLTQLTRNSAIPDKSPCWTPDGRGIVYQRGNQIHAALVRLASMDDAVLVALVVRP